MEIKDDSLPMEGADSRPGSECDARGTRVTRAEWQRMAGERVRDAAALLKVRRWSAAYYLAGYAVECGLKACVVVYVKRNIDVIFRERRFSEKCWTHDFDELLR